MLFFPLGLIVGAGEKVPPTISTFISLNLHGPCMTPLLLLTQQPNVLRLQEFLGAERSANGAGGARCWRHRRVQAPIWDRDGEKRRWTAGKEGSAKEEEEEEEGVERHRGGFDWGLKRERTVNREREREEAEERKPRRRENQEQKQRRYEDIRNMWERARLMKTRTTAYSD